MTKHRYVAKFKRKDENTLYEKLSLLQICLRLMNKPWSMPLNEIFSIST